MIESLGMSIIIGGYIMKSVVYFENVSSKSEESVRENRVSKEASPRCCLERIYRDRSMPYWKRSKGFQSKLQWWWINSCSSIRAALSEGLRAAWVYKVFIKICKDFKSDYNKRICRYYGCKAI